MAAIFNIYAVTALCCVATYLICGIPFGYIVAKTMSNVDVRTTGSKNIGTTNVARSAGLSAAAITLFLDALKGFLCVTLSRVILAALFFNGDISQLVHTSGNVCFLVTVCFFCVVGHVFSCYLHFHGGKGIAVGLGATMGLYWPVSLGILLVFIVLAVPTKYVSLGSISAAVAFPVACIIAGFPPLSWIPAILTGALVVWAHRGNLERLLKGEERKFSIGKPGKQ